MEFLPRNKEYKEYAKKLRNQQTTQERRLWYGFLRDYPIQWNRQRVIGNYIADFLCLRARLVVEIDGGQHYTEQGLCEYDQRRTAFMESLGLELLRFTNTEVMQNFSEVCRLIDYTVMQRLNE